MKTLKCASLDGINAASINVESTFTKGLPSFSIVGLASASIQESKESVNFQSNLYKFIANCTKTNL